MVVSHRYRAEVWCVETSWNVMAHAQKPYFVFRRNGRVHFNRRGHQFSRILAAEVCASAVVTLGTPCLEVVRSVLATHSILQFPLHFPYHESPCAITFQLESTTYPCLPPLYAIIAFRGIVYLYLYYWITQLQLLFVFPVFLPDTQLHSPTTIIFVIHVL